MKSGLAVPEDTGLADLDARSDEELVAAANRAEAAAVEAIYFRYRDWVVSLAFRFSGNRDDALDVLQETFAYLLRKFPGFRLRARMKTFLYPVVKNLSISARRKRARYAGDEAALSEVPAADEPRSLPREELTSVLAALDDAHLEVLLMRFVDAMTLSEIADALAIPLGTVKSRLHNALSTLRDDPRTREYFDESYPGGENRES